jgi:hypothetical protein
MSNASPWPDADIALLKEIYELQCTSRMNAIDYGRRLGVLQQEAFVLELATAITASGSGLAALTLWESPGWSVIWQVLAVLAAIAAVVKPLRAPGKRIEVFTRQQQGYHANFFALKKLGFLIRQAGAVTEDHRKRYDTVYDRHVQLNTEDESTPDEKLRAEAQAAVKQEFPPGAFWWPSTPPLPALTVARRLDPADPRDR